MRVRVLALLAISLGCRIQRVPPQDSLAGEFGATPNGAAECGVTRQTVITGDGIGGLRIGEPLGRLVNHCRVLRDTTIQRNRSAFRIVTLDLVRDTVIAQVARDTIQRIEVSDTAFRTADHLGVDTRVSKFVTLRDAQGVTEDSALFAVVPSHCGLRFRLVAPAPLPPAPQVGESALRRLPGETRVDRVLIIGCNAPLR
jgi:hypothetical protein